MSFSECENVCNKMVDCVKFTRDDWFVPAQVPCFYSSASSGTNLEGRYSSENYKCGVKEYTESK